MLLVQLEGEETYSPVNFVGPASLLSIAEFYQSGRSHVTDIGSRRQSTRLDHVAARREIGARRQ